MKRRNMCFRLREIWDGWLILASFMGAAAAQDAPRQPAPNGETNSPAVTKEDAPRSAPITAAPDDIPLEVDTSGMLRLSKEDPIWIDRTRKWVVIDGHVCLQRGTLEMFACPRDTKEHESIVAVHVKPFDVHVGLLAVGAKQGRPAMFVPKYVPATGTRIDVWVLWKDADGKPHRARAQEWIRNVQTKKEMEYDWVFCGSTFYKVPETGANIYQANGGDFICVSNFPTATLDIPVESSQNDGNLLFEAFTERIPDLKTKVRLILVPRPDAKPATGAPSAPPG